MGTANDLARTLGIPDDLDAAADVILAGHRRRIDLGTVNGEPFFNVASIGLATELARELSSDLKRRWGRARLRHRRDPGAGARPRRFTAWITENGETIRTRTMQIAVGNGRFYGGGTVVAEHAAIDDGHLDLYSLEMRTVWRLALMLRSFRSGEHGAWSEVTTLRGTEFEIRTGSPRPVNADGEIVAETPARLPRPSRGDHGLRAAPGPRTSRRPRGLAALPHPGLRGSLVATPRNRRSVVLECRHRRHRVAEASPARSATHPPPAPAAGGR